MVGMFIVLVPLLVLYAVGYRFDFSDSFNNVRAVGGLYVNQGVADGQIFVNETAVEDARIFRSAAYIQNLEAGLHSIFVESEGLYTWTKQLPVFPHLVTEVDTFHMPVRPQVRLVTEWNDASGRGVLFEDATTTLFAFASSTTPLVVATTTATSSYTINPEYAFVSQRFASSTAEQALLRAQAVFSFDQAPALVPATTTATSTVARSDMVLYEDGGDVYARWVGSDRNRPYFFCVTNQGPEVTSSLYGQHVYEQLVAEFGDVTNLEDESSYGQQYCRTTIRIDDVRQRVRDFDFLPTSDYLVLMLLEDGVYVVEVDDRAWQNTQLLYPGTGLEMLVEGGQIYIKDGDYYLEVETEIAES